MPKSNVQKESVMLHQTKRLCVLVILAIAWNASNAELADAFQDSKEGQGGDDKLTAVVPDARKGIIELPVENLLGSTQANVSIDSNARLADVGTRNSESTNNESGFQNPACQPGLVEWHSDMRTACQASRNSGKPVMLFQLLGKLDQRFT